MLNTFTQKFYMINLEVLNIDFVKKSEAVKYILLFVLRLNVLVNNCSVMSGRSHRFLGNLPVLSGSKVSCSRTQHGGGRFRTPDLSLRSPTLYH